MPLLADVIVDVPTLQTNRPYTYLVPHHLSAIMSKGMRVIVPFGQGSRRIQATDVSNDCL